MCCEGMVNLNLVGTILDEIDNGTGAALVNLDQSKTFDWVGHRFLKAALEAAGFGEIFRTWIRLYTKPPVPKYK